MVRTRDVFRVCACETFQLDIHIHTHTWIALCVLEILFPVFAMVTSSGLLILYDMYLPNRAMMKMTAHAGDATSLDWHPKLRSLIATGGSSDRCVKVWNLEQKLERDEEYYMALNQSTVTSRADSVATDSSTENDSRYEKNYSQEVVFVLVHSTLFYGWKAIHLKPWSCKDTHDMNFLCRFVSQHCQALVLASRNTEP